MRYRICFSCMYVHRVCTVLRFAKAGRKFCEINRGTRSVWSNFTARSDGYSILTEIYIIISKLPSCPTTFVVKHRYAVPLSMTKFSSNSITNEQTESKIIRNVI